MSYIPITKDQFQKLRSQGYSVEKITEFEKRRKSEFEEKPQDQFLPGAEKVKELRKSRPSITTEPFERLASIKSVVNPKEALINIVRGGGETYRAIESSLASAGLEAQRGSRPRDIISAFYGGDVTEKPVEFGDIWRAAGGSEPMARILGLGTAMAVPDVATLGQFGRGITKTTQQVSEELGDAVKTLKTRLPSQAKDDVFLLAQTKKISNIVDDTKKAMGKEIDDFFTYGEENAYGRIPIEKGELKNIISDLFGKYGDEAEKLEAEDMLKNIRSILPVEFKPNVYAAKIVKDAVSEYIPNFALKMKKGISLTPLQSKRVRAYWKLDKLIRDNLPEEGLEYYDYMNKKATDVYRTSNIIKRMVTGELGEPTETSRLISTFMGGGSKAGKRFLINRLNELNGMTKEVINKMNHYRKMQVIKGFTKKAAGAGIGYGVLRTIFGRE